MFDKILKHLSRKKPKSDHGSLFAPIKPICEIRGNTLFVEYNFCYLVITYDSDPYCSNHYRVNLEKQTVIRQEIGTYYCSETLYSEEDVIEYIRYKLR